MADRNKGAKTYKARSRREFEAYVKGVARSLRLSSGWPAMREKYAAFVPHLSCRNDLNRLIQWLCSELAVGHSYSGGGDQLFEPKRVAGGLLGADYAVENGRYRFMKVFGGLNWNPELRSPLTEPNLGIWTEDGFIVENEGIPPDIEVEQWPAEVAAGHDPQLEKAIQVVMEELKANPPKKMVRPPFPVRVK